MKKQKYIILNSKKKIHTYEYTRKHKSTHSVIFTLYKSISF